MIASFLSKIYLFQYCMQPQSQAGFVSCTLRLHPLLYKEDESGSLAVWFLAGITCSGSSPRRADALWRNDWCRLLHHFMDIQEISFWPARLVLQSDKSQSVGSMGRVLVCPHVPCRCALGDFPLLQLCQLWDKCLLRLAKVQKSECNLDIIFLWRLF